MLLDEQAPSMLRRAIMLIRKSWRSKLQTMGRGFQKRYSEKFSIPFSPPRLPMAQQDWGCPSATASPKNWEAESPWPAKRERERPSKSAFPSSKLRQRWPDPQKLVQILI